MASRIVLLLLCLLLAAKGSVATALSVTGAAGYPQPAADACPFAALAAFVGSHRAAAVAADDEVPTEKPAAGTSSPHHHHTCPQPCQFQGVVPATTALPLSGEAATACAPLSAAFTSFVRSPPVHPPRQRG